MPSENKVVVVHYPSPELPLTNEEMARDLSQLGKRDPLWLALMQLLQVRLAQAISDAVGRDENAAGRLAEITEFQQLLKEYRDRGLGLKKSDPQG